MTLAPTIFYSPHCLRHQDRWHQAITLAPVTSQGSRESSTDTCIALHQGKVQADHMQSLEESLGAELVSL